MRRRFWINDLQYCSLYIYHPDRACLILFALLQDDWGQILNTFAVSVEPFISLGLWPYNVLLNVVENSSIKVLQAWSAGLCSCCSFLTEHCSFCVSCQQYAHRVQWKPVLRRRSGECIHHARRIWASCCMTSQYETSSSIEPRSFLLPTWMHLIWAAFCLFSCSGQGTNLQTPKDVHEVWKRRLLFSSSASFYNSVSLATPTMSLP